MRIVCPECKGTQLTLKESSAEIREDFYEVVHGKVKPYLSIGISYKCEGCKEEGELIFRVQEIEVDSFKK